MEKERCKKLKKEENKRFSLIAIFGVFAVFIFLMLNLIFLSADPVGPSSVESVSNETKNTTSAYFFNISGGYIAALNLTANVQNLRWKAFVGWVNGAFTLDDSGGSTIYDWSLTVTTGRVYATRDSSSIEWDLIECANSTSNLADESLAMFHNATASDNITETFTYPGTHDPFWVAGTNIAQNSCPTLNTYNSTGSQDDDFEEMALYDSTSIIYATILEDNLTGYDGQAYDFQMLVPENGSQGFSGATAYYIYVELD